MTSTDMAIGIDLGTTYSCVAVYHDEKIKIITSPEGLKKTPSEVGFRGSERSVGNAARKFGALNSKNTIFIIKRLIGREFDSEAGSKNTWLPFSVVKYKSNWPAVEVDFRESRQMFTPEEVSAMIVHNMKRISEQYLGHEVRNAVITVPACFSYEQRQATKDAAEIAGLNVLQLIDEPTAAALAYGIEREIKEDHKVLIFDLGGGTFDVSIVTICTNFSFKVLATAGNPSLGGTDFDERLLKHFSEEFKMKHQKDIANDPRAMRRLRTACELTKIRLSTNIDAPLEVDALFDGIDFYTTITREKFEELCEDLFSKIFHPIETTLHQATLKNTEINRILLVGGSTRIPKLQELLTIFFDGKDLNNYVNSDEVVAYGAAVQAAKLSGVKFDPIGRIEVLPILQMTKENTSAFYLKDERLSETEKHCLIEKMNSYGQEEKNKNERLETKNKLEQKLNNCLKLKSKSEKEGKLSSEQSRIISEEVGMCKKWLKENENTATKHDYEVKLETIKKLMDAQKTGSPSVEKLPRLAKDDTKKTREIKISSIDEIINKEEPKSVEKQLNLSGTNITPIERKECRSRNETTHTTRRVEELHLTTNSYQSSTTMITETTTVETIIKL